MAKRWYLWYQVLTHWGRDKMAAIFQTTFSNGFSWMKMFEFRLKFHWNLFLRVQLTISQHWFRQWLGDDQATSHYLNQWWWNCWRIYVLLGLNELNTASGTLWPNTSFQLEFLKRAFINLLNDMLEMSFQMCFVYIISMLSNTLSVTEFKACISNCSHTNMDMFVQHCLVRGFPQVTSNGISCLYPTLSWTSPNCCLFFSQHENIICKGYWINYMKFNVITSTPHTITAAQSFTLPKIKCQNKHIFSILNRFVLFI